MGYIFQFLCFQTFRQMLNFTQVENINLVILKVFFIIIIL